MNIFDCLKFYIAMGWPLFPCHSQGDKAKAPLTMHGFKDASLDWQQIEEWYQQFPDCAWGCPTSAERTVLDVDPRNGGNESLARLIAEYGPLPATPKVRTGSGGFHYLLRCPAGTNCGKPYPGIDRKADGGYVIVPPSRIAIPEHEGRAYTWEVKPWDLPIAEAPAWLLGVKGTKQIRTLEGNEVSAKAEADNPWVVQEASLDLLSHQGSPEGERRKTLCQLVGVHLARGDSHGSIKIMAEAWAKRCNPPLLEWEKHVLGMLRKDQAKAEAEAGRMTTILSPSPLGLSVPPSPEAGREGSKSAWASATVDSIAEGSSADLLPSLPRSAESEREKGLSSESNGPEASAEAPCSRLRREQGQEQEQEPKPEPQEGLDWPALPPEAYQGLLGEMLKAIIPETEADPAGVLLGWLACFGNIVGRGAWVTVGPRQHHPALYVGQVGRTSDAKGDGWAASLWPFRQAEPAWASACIANGVGSGEGLIERVADPQTVMNRKGEAEVIPGGTDKRCLLRLSELSRLFKTGRRENATLSEHLREAWDGEPIHVPNRKGNALVASDYAISMMGDITPGVIRKVMESGTEAVDGFANRILWAAVKRSRFLPSGGNIGVLKPFLKPLADALAFAKQAGEVKRDAEADRLWEEVYPTLATSGDTTPHTDRARPYVLRMALLYALADASGEASCSRRSREQGQRQEQMPEQKPKPEPQGVSIGLEHLRAALAVWSYCRASARLIFKAQAPAEPDPLWLRLLNAITNSPGINRSGLREVAGHKVPADEIEEALTRLERSGMAYRKMVQPDGKGRPAECWFPGDGDGEGEGGTNANDNPSSAWVVQPDGQAKADTVGENLGREGSKSANGNSLPCLPGEGSKSDGDRQELLPSLPFLPDSVDREVTGEGFTSLPPLLPAQPEAESKEESRVVRADKEAQAGPKTEATGESVRMVVIHQHYASAKEWVHAVYQSGGSITKQEDGSCLLWLPPEMPEERTKPLHEDAKRWLEEACGEFLSEDAFIWELRNTM